jgi:uncharacterized Zn finger protein (UPF0148 family)
MNNSFKNAADIYLRFLKKEKWIEWEAYKFEYANYVFHNVNWQTQTDNEILEILQNSQKIKYSVSSTGIQFIQKSGRSELKNFISINDISLLKEFKTKNFNDINWSQRTMSFTALSAWLASLFPDKFFPVPMKGFDETIKYLFNINENNFPKVGKEYVNECQGYLKETWELLSQYPIEDLCLKGWNLYYKENPELNIPVKKELSQVDKVWLVQDFHLFVYREILKLYKPRKNDIKVKEENEPTVFEENSVLAQHMRYERNNSFIKKIKEKVLKNNKMLNCQVCGFSFFEKYGKLGVGFIEAHHKKPLSESEGKVKTSKEDIALVCSNCHRMLHRGNPTIEIEDLKEKINKNAL